MKRKKKRLRVDRIIYCLLVLLFIIFLIKLGSYSLSNLKIYNTVKEKNIIIVHKRKVRLWKKTIKYIKDNKNETVIKYKKNYLYLYSSELDNKFIINLDIKKKKINKPLFNNVKSLYIKDTDTLEKINKLEIKLPMFLYKKKYVDVYGITDNDIELVQKRIKVNDKYVKFTLNNKYKDYFITYIDLKDYNVKENINLKKDELYDLSIIQNPSNATDNKVYYSNYDKDIISINDDKIKALKKGDTVIKVKINDIIKEVKVNVVEEEKKVIKEEKKEKFDITVKDGITYVDGIMIVNKTYSLPKDYNPGLQKVYKDAFTQMQSAAKLDNINLFIASGFRSYDDQVKLYNAYVKEDGKEKADTYSARPGYSEHQSGLAADINTAASWFDDTQEAKWLKQNCYKYGFIIRYPKGEEKYTGYKYESWHLRYVGKELAKKIHDNNDISLEHYFNITSVYKD